MWQLGPPVAFFPTREAIMWRRYLISLGLLTMVVTGCDPEVLIAKLSADA